MGRGDLYAFPDQNEGDVGLTTGWRAWITSHKWAAAGVALAVASLIVVLVAAPVCAIHGCAGTRRSNGSSMPEGPQVMAQLSSLPRLLANFDSLVNATEALPPALRQLVLEHRDLATSAIQLLKFADEAVLTQAVKYLQQKYPGIIRFLLHDFDNAAFRPLDSPDDALRSLDDLLAQMPPWSGSINLGGLNLSEAAGGSGTFSAPDLSGILSGLLAEDPAAQSHASTDSQAAVDASTMPGTGQHRRLNQQRAPPPRPKPPPPRFPPPSPFPRSPSPPPPKSASPPPPTPQQSPSPPPPLQPPPTQASSPSRRPPPSPTIAVPPPSTPTAGLPNDPNYPQQWFHRQIAADSVWNSTTTGTKTVVVAMIDTGVDLSHPDLAGNLWINRGEIPNNGIDDDKNGYIDDVYGYDFDGRCPIKIVNGFCGDGGGVSQCSGKGAPQDSAIHGTHVAGLIAAVQNNKLGGTGVAPNVRIMILKASNCEDGGLATGAIVSAFDYAAKMGAHIVSVSIGASYQTGFGPLGPAPPSTASQGKPFFDAIKPLNDKGILVVAAAGNDNIDLDQLLRWSYPYGACLTQLPNVMCIAASDSKDARASFSNFGATTVHLASPGLSIMSTYPVANGSYGILTGTSMATPIAAGAAALVLSVLGAADGNYYRATQVKALLMQSGDTVAGLPVVGNRRLNVKSAVARAVAIRNAGSNATKVSAMPYNPAATATVLLAGFIDAYYSNPQSVLSTTSLQVKDRSSRTRAADATATFNTFKLSSSAASPLLLSITALMNITDAGLFGVKVTTSAAAGSYKLLIGGVGIPLVAGAGSFVVQATGWHTFELQMLNLSTPISLTFLTPSAANYAQLTSAFYISSDASASVPYYSRMRDPGEPYDGDSNGSGSGSSSVATFSGWQLLYNSSRGGSAGSVPFAAGGTPDKSMLYGISASSAWTYSTHTRTVASSPAGSWAAVLQPSLSAAAAATTAIVGFAVSRLQGQQFQGKQYAFAVSCSQCSLSLNGQQLVDIWEGGATNLPTQKVSGCIALLDSSVYNISIAFATNNLATHGLSVTWGLCSRSADTYTSLDAVVKTNTAFVPGDGLMLGYMGGMQCDVWRYSAAADPSLAFSTTPAFKVRLPKYPASVIANATAEANDARAHGAHYFVADDYYGGRDRLLIETFDVTWATPFTFSLAMILPGLNLTYPSAAAAGRRVQLFAARCWTYWSGAPTGGAGGVFRVGNVGGGASATAYLGGQKVYSSAAPSGATAAPTSPTTPSASFIFQLLTIEWLGITSATALQVLDNGRPLSLDLRSFRVPFPVMPSSILASTIYNPVAATNTGGGITCRNGIMLSARYSNGTGPLEVPGSIPYDLTNLRSAGELTSNYQAFDLQDSGYSFNPSLRGVTHYTRAGGYWPARDTTTYRLELDDYDRQVTMLTLANVTAINALAYEGSTNLATSLVFDVYVPAGLVWIDVTVKGSPADGQTRFAYSFIVPGNLGGDYGSWDVNNMCLPSDGRLLF